MGKRLFLRPKDNVSCFELGFISLLIYSHLLNCDRVMICPDFLLRVLSFHFYSTCFFKRVNFHSNLFKKIQQLNIKITKKLSWIHYRLSWEQSFVLVFFTSDSISEHLDQGYCAELHRLFTAQGHLAEGKGGWNLAHALLAQLCTLALGCIHLEGSLLLIFREAFMHKWWPLFNLTANIE